MNYLEAPNKILGMASLEPYVFLAGGITDCPDWQKTIRDSLEDLDDGTLINPRREDFPMGDPKAGLVQIKWEFDALWNWTDIFTMWFCKETIGPICLYELGAHLARVAIAMKNRSSIPFQRVVIGFDPDYERAFDVVAQTGLILGDRFPFGMSIDQHAANIREAVIGVRDTHINTRGCEPVPDGTVLPLEKLVEGGKLAFRENAESIRGAMKALEDDDQQANEDAGE